MARYLPAREPYAHQREALAQLEGKPAFALFMAMRTGKTKTLLDDFGRLELAGEVQQLLVIAPAGVYRTWKTACEEHLSDDLRSRVKVRLWESKATPSQLRELDRFLDDAPHPCIFLVNIEALSKVKKAQQAVIRFLRAGRTMVAIDESTTIKNPTSKRTKFILSIADLTSKRRILSGLPSPKDPLDLFAQFLFLDPRITGHRSFYTFRSRYAVLKQEWFGGRAIQTVVGHQNLDELRAKIAPYCYWKRLEDCYDMPASIYMMREVELTPEQSRLYNEMKNFATTQLAQEIHVTATIVITQILRLHQILCGHTVDEMGNLHELPELRTAELLSVLEEYPEGKAIVWCSYDADIRRVSAALAKAYGPQAVARFWGGNEREREAEEVRFKTDPECRFMVATPSAGGKGRTWDVADLVIYYSNSSNLEHRMQSEERPKGVGKTKSIAYIDLVCPGTVEVKFIEALRNKLNLAGAVSGSNYQDWLI